ncbi:MAG: hypothetical protein AAFQ66_11985 [Pseudomonadota bacterium]
MKVTTTLAALTLAVLPTMSLAVGCNYGKAETANVSCAEGMVFDSQAGKCVEQVSS